MEECKKKGLCHNCDKQFASDHHCTTQKLYLLDEYAPMELPKEDFEDAIIEIVKESNQPMEVVP